MAAKQVENIVPDNKPIRKPTEKKTFDMGKYRDKIGAQDIPDKPLEWIKIDDDLEAATGLPGFAKGYVNVVRGYSDTGKSTAASKGIVNAQKMGILPIIIDTENNLGRERLTLMGFDWDGDYIFIDNEYLLENFGKKQDKERTEAAIEDQAKCISFFLEEQSKGNLPFDLCFVIDSIGTLNCIKTINALEKNDSDNNMWNAGATDKSMMSILNNAIPNSRKIDKPYTNTLIAVQKIWYDSMNKVIKHKHGELYFYSARLIYHFGGILSHGTRKMIATSKKRDVQYGVETKVTIIKNHIEGPLGGISMEGKIVSTPHGYVIPENIDQYKKKNILYFRNLFGEDVGADDIEMKTKNTTIDDLSNEYVESIE